MDVRRDEHIGGTTTVAQASRKIANIRFKWYGHVMRMKEEQTPRRIHCRCAYHGGKRRKGRPNLSWKDACYAREI